MIYKMHEKQLRKKGRSPGRPLKKNSISNHNLYDISFKPSAEKELASLTKSSKILIKDKIDSLAIDPFPHGYVKLTDKENIFRVRVRDFRILYTVIKDKILILILKIGNRRDIYKKKS